MRTGNPRQAAIACGSTEVSAPGYANHALKIPAVQEYLDELREEKRRASLLSGVNLQLTLQAAATADIGACFEQGPDCEYCGRKRYANLPIPELPEEIRRAIQGWRVTKRGGDSDGRRELILTYEYTLLPKASALELLGKSQGAFTDKHVVEKSTRFELIVERLRKNVGKAQLGQRKQKALPVGRTITIEAQDAQGAN